MVIYGLITGLSAGIATGGKIAASEIDRAFEKINIRCAIDSVGEGIHKFIPIEYGPTKFGVMNDTVAFAYKQFSLFNPHTNETLENALTQYKNLNTDNSFVRINQNNRIVDEQVYVNISKLSN